jgi:hypothetical protein
MLRLDQISINTANEEHQQSRGMILFSMPDYVSLEAMVLSCRRQRAAYKDIELSVLRKISQALDL